MVPTLTGVSMVQGSMMHVSPLLPTLLRQPSHNNTTPPVVAKIPNSIANYPPLPPMVTRPANNSIPQPTETQQNVPFQKRKPRPASMALIAPVETRPECFYCLQEATHLCNWCRSVYYCDPGHYQMHRCHSKCWPFKVKG